MTAKFDVETIIQSATQKGFELESVLIIISYGLMHGKKRGNGLQVTCTACGGLGLVPIPSTVDSAKATCSSTSILSPQDKDAKQCYESENSAKLW